LSRFASWFGTTGVDAPSVSSSAGTDLFWVKASVFSRHWLNADASGGNSTFTTDHLFHIISFNNYCVSSFHASGTVLGSGGLGRVSVFEDWGEDTHKERNKTVKTDGAQGTREAPGGPSLVHGVVREAS
jgi:hypothetical protein